MRSERATPPSLPGRRAPKGTPYGSASEEAKAPSDALNVKEGRYLYGMATGGKKISLGPVGLEDSEVYTLPYKDLSAIVHDCSFSPYYSEEAETVKKWALAHEKVIELALEKFTDVLPFRFGTITRGEDNLKNWLEENYPVLKLKIKKIKGKAEYGVQIFWDLKIAGESIVSEHEELKRLKEEIKSRSEGSAYMIRQIFEKLLKTELTKRGDEQAKAFYQRIKACAGELVVGKCGKGENGAQMLLNLSCLASKEESQRLGEELEKISSIAGFSVRFTGPWPPYSFMGGA